MSSFEEYESPFSWRYGSHPMRSIWSEKNKHLLWRRIWLALAKTQMDWNLVSQDQYNDLLKHVEQVDMKLTLDEEKRIQHDLMAEVKVFASQCPVGGGIIHLGATSMDVKDNAEVMQQLQALNHLLEQLEVLILKFQEKMEQYAGLPVMAFTHLQPAEPTTLGYRLANYAQDFLDDYRELSALKEEIKGKGFKGAVGNAASYYMLLGEDGFEEFEEKMSIELGLSFFSVASQTYTRKQDLKLANRIASAAATAYKFALDLRVLQSEVIGELAEPFGKHQVGSSAMPFKRNPINSEKIDSLTRMISAYPNIAWNNYAQSILERTLDDSANRRSYIPEIFLGLDEIFMTLIKVITDLQVHPAAIERNLKTYGPFSAIERILLACVKNGADRQEIHEHLRQMSMQAWQEIQAGRENPLRDLIRSDEMILSYINLSDIDELLNVDRYTGMAEKETRQLCKKIQQDI